MPLPGLDAEMDKMDQAAVLYFPANKIARKAGTRCGACWKFVRGESMCVEVIGEISADKTCALYVNGTPFETLPDVSVTKVTKTQAGYGDGDTQCGNCKHFGGPGECERVKSTPEDIESGGCCGEHGFKKKRKV